MAEGQTISFRVPASVAKLLEEAGAREGLSRSEYARKLVESSIARVQSEGAEGGAVAEELRALRELISRGRADAPGGADGPVGGVGRAELLRELRRVDTHLNELRAAIATGVAALLCQAAGVDPREAESWVIRNLYPTDQ
jgi:hypothetical protein